MLSVPEHLPSARLERQTLVGPAWLTAKEGAQVGIVRARNSPLRIFSGSVSVKVCLVPSTEPSVTTGLWDLSL